MFSETVKNVSIKYVMSTASGGGGNGKATVSVLHNAQLLLNKQKQIWGGVYIH